MKKTLVMLLVMLLFAIPAFADNLEMFDETEVGAKVDLPELVKLGPVDLGVEAGIDSIHDLLNDTENDASSYLIAKATIHWTLVDLSK